jgi:hypothetical protein
MSKKKYRLYKNDVSWDPSFANLSRKMQEIVNDKIVNLITYNPYDSEYLRTDLEGLRSYNKFQTDSRIIFAICEECRANGFKVANNCMDCESIPDDAIMLFAFGGHDTYNRLGRRRSKAVEKARKFRLRRRT